MVVVSPSTVAMLTGLIPPTAGDAKIYGHSITTDLAGNTIPLSSSLNSQQK